MSKEKQAKASDKSDWDATRDMMGLIYQEVFYANAYRKLLKRASRISVKAPTPFAGRLNLFFLEKAAWNFSLYINLSKIYDKNSKGGNIFKLVSLLKKVDKEAGAGHERELEGVDQRLKSTETLRTLIKNLRNSIYAHADFSNKEKYYAIKEDNKLTDDEVDALVDAAIETILVGAKIADFGSFSFEEADAGQELIVFYEELYKGWGYTVESADEEAEQSAQKIGTFPNKTPQKEKQP